LAEVFAEDIREYLQSGQRPNVMSAGEQARTDGAL
jgi:hypothetical protein